MMASEGLFTTLVTIALIVTTAAPVVLLALLARDWIRGQLW